MMHFFITYTSVFLLIFFNTNVFSSSDSLSTLTTTESTITSNVSSSRILFYECLDIMTKHLACNGSNFLDSVNSEIFRKAIDFAARLRPSFDDVIMDKNLSVSVHCFLLFYFLNVTENFYKSIGDTSEIYSKFIQYYSDHLAFTHSVGMADEIVVRGRVIPVIFELVGTGNFLNYSFLLRDCIDRLSEREKMALYTCHCRQYINRHKPHIEKFKMGIDFIQMYAPRDDLLNVSGIENGIFASKHPDAFLFLALYPLKKERCVVETEKISEISGYFNFHLQLLMSLSNFLEACDSEIERCKFAKLFNAAFNLEEHLLEIVNFGLFSLFQAWIQFQDKSRFLEDDWNKITLKEACDDNFDERFKVAFDFLIMK